MMEVVSIPRYVYFAEVTQLRMMKIGCSVRPFERLTAVAEWVPFKVKLVATIPGNVKLERDFHSHFQPEWSHLEWFHISPRMEKMVDDIQAQREIVLDKCPADPKHQQNTQLKSLATRLINQAETRAGIPDYTPIRWPLRPSYICEAIASYSGRNNPPPDDYVFAAIRQYERELKADA